MKRSVPLDEQETIISFQPAAVSGEAEVYTTIPSTMVRMRNLMKANTDDVRIREDDYALIATVPRNWIKVSRPRQMSEETKKKITERLAAAREAKKNDVG